MLVFKSLKFILIISMLIGNTTINYHKSLNRFQCTIKSVIYTIILNYLIIFMHIFLIIHCFTYNNDIATILEITGNYTSRYANLFQYFIATFIYFFILFATIYSRNLNKSLLNNLNEIDENLNDFITAGTIKYNMKTSWIKWIAGVIYVIVTFFNIYISVCYIKSFDLIAWSILVGYDIIVINICAVYIVNVTKIFINHFNIIIEKLNENIDKKNNDFNLFPKIMSMIEKMLNVKYLLNKTFGWYLVVHAISDLVFITIGCFTIKVEFELYDVDFAMVFIMALYIGPTFIKAILVFVTFEAIGKQVRK